jgi:hypothetical protein
MTYHEAFYGAVDAFMNIFGVDDIPVRMSIVGEVWDHVWYYIVLIATR